MHNNYPFKISLSLLEIYCHLYSSIGPYFSLLSSIEAILLIPFTIILPKFIGLDGVWAAGACADSLSVIITLVLLKKEFKQLDKMQLEKIA